MASSLAGSEVYLLDNCRSQDIDNVNATQQAKGLSYLPQGTFLLLLLLIVDTFLSLHLFLLTQKPSIVHDIQ